MLSRCVSAATVRRRGAHTPTTPPAPVNVGDLVELASAREATGRTVGVVTEINVPVAEIAKFGDGAKSILGMFKPDDSVTKPDEL